MYDIDTKVDTIFQWGTFWNVVEDHQLKWVEMENEGRVPLNVSVLQVTATNVQKRSGLYSSYNAAQKFTKRFPLQATWFCRIDIKSVLNQKKATLKLSRINN